MNRFVRIITFTLLFLCAGLALAQPPQPQATPTPHPVAAPDKKATPAAPRELQFTSEIQQEFRDLVKQIDTKQSELQSQQAKAQQTQAEIDRLRLQMQNAYLRGVLKLGIKEEELKNFEPQPTQDGSFKLVEKPKAEAEAPKPVKQE